MPSADPFSGAFERPEQLREFYDAAMEAAVRKDIGHIDALCRRLIAAAPMLFVATFSSEGHADVSPRGGQPELLERLTPVGKPPKTAIVVAAEEVYTHCPKAFVRSKLWNPDSWPDPATLPTSAEVSLAHQRNPELTLEQVQQRERESLAKRLD
jgi:predicted pyridoxine 5'-phosphate oxidase superfamily flavin-nucleotide-binding protein